jgi:hypothetical protein
MFDPANPQYEAVHQALAPYHLTQGVTDPALIEKMRANQANIPSADPFTSITQMINSLNNNAGKTDPVTGLPYADGQRHADPWHSGFAQYGNQVYNADGSPFSGTGTGTGAGTPPAGTPPAGTPSTGWNNAEVQRLLTARQNAQTGAQSAYNGLQGGNYMGGMINSQYGNPWSSDPTASMGQQGWSQNTQTGSNPWSMAGQTTAPTAGNPTGGSWNGGQQGPQSWGGAFGQSNAWGTSS